MTYKDYKTLDNGIETTFKREIFKTIAGGK